MSSRRLAFPTGRAPVANTSVPYKGPLTQPNHWPAIGGRGTSAKIFRQRQRRAGVFPLRAAGPGTVGETFLLPAVDAIGKNESQRRPRVARLDVSSVSGSGRRPRNSNRWFQRASLSLLVKSQEG